MLVCVALSPHFPVSLLVICVWCCVAVAPIIPSEPTMFLTAHLLGSSLGMKKLVHLGVWGLRPCDFPRPQRTTDLLDGCSSGFPFNVALTTGEKSLSWLSENIHSQSRFGGVSIKREAARCRDDGVNFPELGTSGHSAYCSVFGCLWYLVVVVEGSFLISTFKGPSLAWCQHSNRRLLLHSGVFSCNLFCYSSSSRRT